MSNDTFAPIDDLVIRAANLQSGTDVVPIRLIREIRLLRPELATVTISQLIDELGSRNFGRIEPPSDDPGERLFFIDHQGVVYAEQVLEKRRPKTIKEKLGQITRSDWIAFAALVVSTIALFKS
jgi:hypothetical protein